MLDTNARKYVQPVFERIAEIFIRLKVTANQLTVVALILGLTASIFVYAGLGVLGVLLLWLSGLLDALDGTIARKTASSNPIGTVMDILFDRIVEIMVLLAVALSNPTLGIYTAIVFSSIIISMTVFLTVGALAEKKGEKSFYYQPGLVERTEGFIMISLTVLVSSYRIEIMLIFAALILFTAFQRVIEAARILK